MNQRTPDITGISASYFNAQERAHMRNITGQVVEVIPRTVEIQNETKRTFASVLQEIDALQTALANIDIAVDGEGRADEIREQIQYLCLRYISDVPV